MRTTLRRCSASLRLLRQSPTVANRLTRPHGVLQPPKLSSRCNWHRSATTAATDRPAEGNMSKALEKFEELGTRDVLHRTVVQTLTRTMGLETMTEVQAATLNVALDGTDIIAQAKTGTGKTLAFLIPVLQNILKTDPQLAEQGSGRRGKRTTADDIRAIIISPTRELAEQIAVEAKRLTSNTGVIVQTAVGGSHKAVGLRAIQQQGCHLLVGTPGRLKDILTDRYSRVQAPDLSALVFDEADRLLDQGFWPSIQEIMQCLPAPREKDRQTMMFSATVPDEVVDLVRATLKSDFKFVKCVRDDEEPTHARVPQRFVTTFGLENKLPVLAELTEKALEASKGPDGKPFKAIVYYNSTAEVELAYSALKGMRPTSQSQEDQSFRRHPWSPLQIFGIHSKLTQQGRTRSADGFRACTSGILLSSDVTARGMDFPGVTHVIQMAIPPSREQYIHRIGRTARAGKEGEGWLILSDFEAGEARRRLRGIPLTDDNSITTAQLDLSQAASVPAQAAGILRMLQDSIQGVGAEIKSAAYRALLGVYGFVYDKNELVQYMNNLTKFGWGMERPPLISPLLAQKLGLSRVRGLELGHDSGSFGGGRPARRFGEGGRGPSPGLFGEYGGGRSSRSAGQFGGGRFSRSSGQSESSDVPRNAQGHPLSAGDFEDMFSVSKSGRGGPQRDGDGRSSSRSDGFGSRFRSEPGRDPRQYR